MFDKQVTCIIKPNRDSTHEHITHIGNKAEGWNITREVAIQRIDSKEYSYYTIDAFTRTKVYVGVVRPEGRAPYLRTYADGKWNDNLLALSSC